MVVTTSRQRDADPDSTERTGTNPGPAGADAPLSSLTTTLATFIALLARGFWPVLVYPPGVTTKTKNKTRVTKGKEPIGFRWGLVRWTIEKARGILKRWPAAGVGVCLGPGRAPGGKWLIDVEGDGPEAEESRARLLGRKSVPTLGWGSVRGGHQLLVADGERLTAIAPRLKPFQVEDSNQPGVFHIPALPGLELRLGGYKAASVIKQVQSVVPPTPGTDGKPREWNGVEVVAIVPESLYATLEAIADEAEAQARPRGNGTPRDKQEPRTKPRTKAGPKTPGLSRAHNYLRNALANEVKRIEATEPGSRRDKYRNAAYNLAGYLHYYQRFGIGYTEAELESTLTAALAIGVGPGDPVVDETVSDAIAAGKAKPQDLPDELHRSVIAATNGKAKRDGGGAHKEDGLAASASGDDRPEIVISTAEKEVNDEAIKALSNDPNLFSLGYVLATVIHDGDPHRGVEYPDGEPPRLAPISSATLRERMTAVARWRSVNVIHGKRARGKIGLIPAHPPDWSVKAVMDRGRWPGVRRIVGIVEAPTIRPDGSVLDSPGYDPATGLYYVPNGRFGSVPDRPTIDQARAAAARLLNLVCDFPFLDEDHKAAWLAALLSVLGRPAIDGPCPLFAFDGNCPGSGKSMLADLVAMIATCRRMPRTIWPHGRDVDEEMRKRITSLALAGERFTLLDNVSFPHTLGGASLDAALTATWWKDRLLSRNEAPELPLMLVWFASGNNLQFGTDVIRRTVPCRIVSKLENPEERDDFKNPDLLGHVRTQRGRYLADALTVIRGYFVADLPVSVKPLGSYESWVRIIVGAVKWATNLDPCQPRELVKSEDADTRRRRALIAGLVELSKIEDGMTTAEILEAVKREPEEFALLRASLLELSRDKDLPSTRIVGNELRGMKDRIIGGYLLEGKEDKHKKVALWTLTPVAGSAGCCGVSCGASSARENGELSADKAQIKALTHTYRPPPQLTPQHPADPATPVTDGRERGEL